MRHTTELIPCRVDLQVSLHLSDRNEFVRPDEQTIELHLDHRDLRQHMSILLTAVDSVRASCSAMPPTEVLRRLSKMYLREKVPYKPAVGDFMILDSRVMQICTGNRALQSETPALVNLDSNDQCIFIGVNAADLYRIMEGFWRPVRIMSDLKVTLANVKDGSTITMPYLKFMREGEAL